MVHLTTPRLILREFVEADLSELLNLDSDPKVMRYISDGKPRGAEMIRNFLDSCIQNYPRQDGFGFWAALEQTSNEFVGWFHFRPDLEFPDEIEVGYRLKRPAWGRGLATEGAMALIRKGFQDHGVRSVTGRTMKANLASAKVLAKAGLSLVGEYQEDRFPGEDKTAILMRLRAEGE